MDCDRYSSKLKLLRVTAFVLLCVRRMKRRENAMEQIHLNAENLKEAENIWIRSVQSTAFPEENSTFEHST
jgi:hypothetical protein